MTLALFTGFSVSVSAAEEVASGDCGDSVTYTLTKNGGTVTVNGEEKDAYTLTISGTGDMYNNYSSSTNPPPWYDIKDTITSVVIGNGVTLIGRSSFYQCRNLASVTIPDSVTTINGSAFSGCKSLTSVTIPESVTSIGQWAFFGCSLTSVTIPENITTFGGGEFRSCKNLTSVTIRGTVISEGMFMDCSSLTSITIPESVTSIGNKAFSGCSSLNQIIYKDGLDVDSATIPDTTTQIKYTVSGGTLKITKIELGDGRDPVVIDKSKYTYDETDKDLMKNIAHTHTYDENNVCTLCGMEKPNTGDDDDNNDSIDLKTDGSTLTISGTGAVNSEDLSEVADKDSITDVVIEDGITAVGSGAFDGFTGLETVTIPDSVQSIGSGAFDGTKLDTVFYESGAEVSGFPAGVTQVEYSVNGDGKIIIESIKQGDVVSEDGKIVIPNKIGGVDVAGVAEGIRDKVTVEGHAHSYENGSCTICGAADPNGGSGSQGNPSSNPSYPPSRPTTPSTPVVTPTVTTKTETAATTAEEEIISDGDYTGEDISSGAGDNSDDWGIEDMSMFVILLAIAAAISSAVLVKKIVF